MARSRRPQFYDPSKRKKRESELEATLGRYAKKLGCLWWKLSSPSNAGVPDRILVTPRGLVGFLELKREGEKPNPNQKVKMGELHEHGAYVDWCDNVEQGKKIIDMWCSLPGPHDEVDPLAEFW